MNVIFLDVDGVLNSSAALEQSKGKGYIMIIDYHLQMLAKIYHATNAKIVLSSSWRDLDDEFDIHVYWMYEYLVNELARYDMKIMSKTPNVKGIRPLEIKTWLDNRIDKDKINFVSLDDDWSYDDYKKYGIEDCLVKTEFFCTKLENGGLQEKHVALAIKKLLGNIGERV